MIVIVFLTADSRACAVVDGYQEVEVTGIMKGKEMMAIINGSMVRIGDDIGGLEIIDIAEKGVFIKDKNETLFLRLRKKYCQESARNTKRGKTFAEKVTDENVFYDLAKQSFSEASREFRRKDKERSYKLFEMAIGYAKSALEEIEKVTVEKNHHKHIKRSLADEMEKIIEWSRVRIPYYGDEEAEYQIPVLVVNYFPATEGKIITKKRDIPLGTARSMANSLVYNVISALEKGSSYHGYKDKSARASLKYKVAGTLNFLKPIPVKGGRDKGMTDYYRIMTKDLDIRKWVEEKGVKEVWICYHEEAGVKMWESNMSSPYGDISNSDRDINDLPVIGKTYTVYHYNYQRGVTCAVENHMHQIEVVLTHINKKLFQDQFIGNPGQGRCGWSHCPPNAEGDYDWHNKKYVMSDIEDWKPYGGTRNKINSYRWGNTGLGWFVYWMQNIPGKNNGITYNGRPLRNWWVFMGEYDKAIRKGYDLFAD